ncbi:hypothetical protein TNCV_2987031 [Trichonephila clavipes]|nr:hypothetical protein TNCV_2987031 [Trichonephila clavipes]
MQAVETKIHENRRYHSFIGIFRRFTVDGVQNCINEDPNFKKLCSLWVPRLLTVKHKDKRLASSLNFSIRLEEVGDDMLSLIVTGDET